MNYDLVIKNGRIITAREDFVGDVAILGERIAAIGQNLSGTQEIEAHGLYVIPGAIDGHVHFFQTGGLDARPDQFASDI